MKPFSIVITGANSSLCWYSNRIGETLKSTGFNLEENCIEVDVSHLEMNKSGRAWVHLNDCELAPQPEAAELALLRRVAEAAEAWVGSIGYTPAYCLGMETWENLCRELAAWKAGTK